jgi:hypothetical protein
MAAPPRDEAGRVIPHDDRELIADDSFVLRSIPFEHLKSVAAGGGAVSLESSVFRVEQAEGSL